MFPLHSHPPGLKPEVVFFWCQMKLIFFLLITTLKFQLQIHHTLKVKSRKYTYFRYKKNDFLIYFHNRHIPSIPVSHIFFFAPGEKIRSNLEVKLYKRVVLWSGYAISLIWGEKRCVSDMFDINVFVLKLSGIVCFQSFVASNICELVLWQDKGNLFRRGHTFDGILHWMPQCGGKIWNALILVDNVFVLQATQSISSQNLEASRLQVHFLQHVKLHVFGEDIFRRNTDF